MKENLKISKAEKIQELIASDELLQACTVLMDSVLGDQGHALAGRIIKTERLFKTSGTISYQEYILEINTIREAILEEARNLDQVDEEGNTAGESLEDFWQIIETGTSDSAEAARKYIKGLEDRLGKIKTLGQSNPVLLQNLYVRTNILKGIPSRIGKRIQDLEENFDYNKRDLSSNLTSIEGLEVVNQQQKIVVLGKPGAGKTTFLRYLSIAMLEANTSIKVRRLPIFITLRDWADQKIDLFKHVEKEFKECGFKQAEVYVGNLLKQGKCIVLLDGLDEISQESNLADVIRHIRDFLSKYYQNQFVLSCRIAAYNHWFEQFSEVELADFNEGQIKIFVNNWFSIEKKLAKNCLKHLSTTPQLWELASIPLLLSLLCITYSEDKDFPSNRAELYERAINALLRKWDASRNIRRSNPYKKLSTRRKEDMFAHIAFKTFKGNRHFIRERDLTKMIEDFIVNLPGFKKERIALDSTEILQNIESHHGIFIERARAIYSFGHLTFQEYFAAKYFTENAPNGMLENLVNEHLYDDKWKEVFLLVVGMLFNSDEMFIKMLNKNKLLAKEGHLKGLLQGVNQIIHGGRKRNKILISRMKAGCFSFVFTSALDLALGRDLNEEINSELDRALDRALDLVNKLDEAMDSFLAAKDKFDLGNDLAEKLDREFANDLGNTFTIPIVNQFLSFLKGNLLITECLNVDCYVSQKVREQILSEMFDPV